MRKSVEAEKAEMWKKIQEKAAEISAAGYGSIRIGCIDKSQEEKYDKAAGNLYTGVENRP